MALTNETIKERLIAKFGEQLTHFEEPYGLLTFEAPAGAEPESHAISFR
jgi:NADH-quinone oxidoreductase subunit C